MTGLVIAALVALGVFGYEKSKPKATAAPPDVPVAPSSSATAAGAIGGTEAGATTTTITPAPPRQSTQAPATGPGVYPAGTPGAFPILVQVVGGDGDSYVTAAPGGQVGPAPGSSKTFWYGPGTSVVFSASIVGFAPFTAFDHFEGPGVAVRSSVISVPQIQQAGFVRGVFSFLGRPGG